MTSKRRAAGYSPEYWGTCIARLAQDRVPKWCPWSSMAGGALRITGVVWSRLISQLHPGTKAVAKKSLPGAGILSRIERGSWCWCLSDWLQRRVRQGRNAWPRCKGAGESVSGACCQQQELFVFRDHWRHSDSHKPQACIKQKSEIQTAPQALQFSSGAGIG